MSSGELMMRLAVPSDSAAVPASPALDAVLADADLVVLSLGGYFGGSGILPGGAHRENTGDLDSRFEVDDGEGDKGEL